MDKLDLIYDMVQNINDKMDQNNTELRERMDKNNVALRERLLIEETHTEDMISKIEKTDHRVENIEKKFTLSYLLKLIVGTIITLGSVSAAIAKIADVF